MTKKAYFMPDSTRPTSSMFFSVVKSILTGDGSLRRMASHPGGQNFSIIFAYITSSAYREMMIKENSKGKIGKLILQDHDWISPREFLKQMEWIDSETNEPSQHAVNMATNLFNSFAQDEIFKIRDAGDTFEYKYIKDLEFPDDEQIMKARESNKLFMMCIDDLIIFIPKSFDKGYPVASRSSTEMQPLWEALHNDPLVTAFRSEHIRNIANNLPKLKNRTEFNYLEIGVFTGLGTIETIDEITKKYSDLTINYHVVEDVEPLLRRAKQKIEYHLSNKSHILGEKNIKFNMKYTHQPYSEKIDEKSDSIDRLSIFQILHYMKDQYREEFFRNIHGIITNDCVITIGQSTSYKLDFPYPFTLIYSATEDFNGYPVKSELKSILEPYFGSIKSTGLDAIWTLKKPTHK